MITQRPDSIKKIDNFEGYRQLYCIDQSLKGINPTGTFKDKQPQALESYLELLRQFHPMKMRRRITIAAMSTGNTAFSMTYFALKYSDRFGGRGYEITPVIFIPDNLEERAYFGPDVNGLRVPTERYISMLERRAENAGGKVIRLDFGTPGEKSENDYLSSLRLAKVTKEHGLIAPDGRFLNMTEGLDSTAMLTAEQVESVTEHEYATLPKMRIKAYQQIIRDGPEDLEKRFRVKPDYLVCQFGAGILFNETVDYLRLKNLHTKVVPVAVGDPNSCADKIYASYWADEPAKLAFGRTTTSKHDQSIIYGIDDWEIGKVMEQLKDELDAEASGIAGFAPLYRLEEIVPGLNRKKHVVLTINTGNGLPNFVS